MSLVDLMSDKGAVALSFYNVVSSNVLANKGVRDSLGLVVNADDLIVNLQMLLDGGYQPVTVKDAATKRLSKTFCLMACDGYDLSETPVLDFCMQNNIPLAFSIPAALVGDNKPSWTNQIEIALQQALDIADGQTIALQVPDTDTILEISDVTSAIAARHTLKDSKDASTAGACYVDAICKNLTQACRRLGKDVAIRPMHDSNSPFDRKMTWLQLRERVQDGSEIITHGHSHNGTFGNDVRGSTDDVGYSLTLLQERINLEQKPTILTYPEGVSTPPLSKAIQEGTDIEHAFTMSPGVITSETPDMALPRYTIGAENLATPNGMN